MLSAPRPNAVHHRTRTAQLRSLGGGTWPLFLLLKGGVNGRLLLLSSCVGLFFVCLTRELIYVVFFLFLAFYNDNSIYIILCSAPLFNQQLLRRSACLTLPRIRLRVLIALSPTTHTHRTCCVLGSLRHAMLTKTVPICARVLETC